MFDRLLALLTGESPLHSAETVRDDDLRVAVAALLVEAARMDDQFDVSERTAIKRILMERFDLDEAMTETILAAAERAVSSSTDVYRFTRRIADAYGPAERIGLIELMWEVVYADGRLDPDEDALMRRVAGLVFVDDRDRGAARLRVIARLGLSDPG